MVTSKRTQYTYVKTMKIVIEENWRDEESPDADELQERIEELNGQIAALEARKPEDEDDDEYVEWMEQRDDVQNLLDELRDLLNELDDEQSEGEDSKAYEVWEERKEALEELIDDLQDRMDDML